MHLLRLAARQFGGGIHASRCLSCGLVAPLSGTFSSGTQSLHGVMARCNGSVSPPHLRGLGDHIGIFHRRSRVAGTYTGSRVGTAQLTGRQMGADFDLTITWPNPLYGDKTANLRVASLDPDRGHGPHRSERSCSRHDRFYPVARLNARQGKASPVSACTPPGH